MSTRPSSITPHPIAINTSLGDVVVDSSTSIYFPNGIPGFPRSQHLCIADIPAPYKDIYPTLRILQSLDNHDISLLLYPVRMDAGLYDIEDIDSICNMLNLYPGSTSFYLIVSTQYDREKEQLTLTGNARAPIVIDEEAQEGYQYIFTHIKYSVRHDINTHTSKLRET